MPKQTLLVLLCKALLPPRWYPAQFQTFGDIFLLPSSAVSVSAWLPKGYELFSFLAIRLHKQKRFVLHTRKPSGIGQASPTCHGYAFFSCLIAFPPSKINRNDLEERRRFVFKRNQFLQISAICNLPRHQGKRAMLRLRPAGSKKLGGYRSRWDTGLSAHPLISTSPGPDCETKILQENCRALPCQQHPLYFTKYSPFWSFSQVLKCSLSQPFWPA